ncbi:MAG TPA: hypothetical protein VKB13_00590 [Gaiellaceae bacterium]|nr:hypothetical protein [Gaiellaceae bacterium]
MQSASGAAQLNFGLDHLITPLRDMGHIARVMFGGCADNMNRMALLPYGPTAGPGSPPAPNVGSTGSFGVDLGTFALLKAEDRTRVVDASAAVVERN